MTNFAKEKANKNNHRTCHRNSGAGGARKKKFRINLNMLNKIIFSLIIVFGVYYVAGINDLTVKGFKLQELRVDLKEVEYDNDSLELKIMSTESSSALGERINGLDMVAVGNIEYISSAGSVVAIK